MALRDRYEWLIGMRYLRSGQRRGFLSFISAISMVGLALGVGVLVVVMSVMNGFEHELRSRILGVTSHGQVMGQGETLPDWRMVQETARQAEGVLFAVPYIESRAMAAVETRLAGVELRGIDPAQELQATSLEDSMLEGQGSLNDLVQGEFRVAIGETLAAQLGVAKGDRLVIVVPKATVTPLGVMPRTRAFQIAGIFRTGMYQYDSALVLMHVADAARLLQLGDRMTGVRLTLADPLQAERVVMQVAGKLVNEHGQDLSVSNWTRIHTSFFRSIQMTKSMLFVILSMIVAIAAFNIVATLVMVVKDKEPDIAILRTQGAGPANILRMFTVQGVAIGVFGVAAGLALGAAISFNLEWLVHQLEKVTGTRFLDARVYFMSDLPAQVQLGDVVQVALVALVLCLLATIYPAWRASRVLPAEVLRHD